MANNQYNFLDYAGLSLFWNNVKSIIEENELATAAALTNLDTRVDNLEGSKADKVHTHYYAGSTSVGGAANWLLGNYTGNGGRQQPNYFGVNKVGALMMNTPINGNSEYKDFLIMDCYSGSDVGGAVAFGVNRQSLGAYIMRSAAGRETWGESAELLGTHNYTSYTVKKDGTGASGTWGIGITGNAATATKIGTSTVGSITLPVYINSGTPTAIHAFPESYLSWGGSPIEGHISPIDAACCDDLGNNKLAFLPADCITIEYTTDGGSTWIDYGAGDDQKISLVTYGNIPFYIGKGLGTMTNSNCSNYQVRITVSAVNSSGICKIYTDPQKLLINYSSQGAYGGKVKLETQTLGDYENNEDVWSTMGTYRVEGYSGWNSIPLGFAFGGFEGQSSNIAKLRLTLSITSVNPGESYTNFASILGIRLIGINLWITPSIMSSRGHLYAYDAYQNADFPAAVKATNFRISGGTSSQFLKADGSIDSNTYSKSGHTHAGFEVTLTGYSRRDSYEEIKSTDTVNQAIAKLEGALSGLEALLASI